MKRRVVTVVLWFYVVWYAAAMVVGTLGLSPAIGPIAGAIAATVVAVVLRRDCPLSSHVGDTGWRCRRACGDGSAASGAESILGPQGRGHGSGPLDSPVNSHEESRDLSSRLPGSPGFETDSRPNRDQLVPSSERARLRGPRPWAASVVVGPGQIHLPKDAADVLAAVASREFHPREANDVIPAVRSLYPQRPRSAR